jgi:acyl-CoA synthetase (AMP-forming)/AMP-acid ligase II
VVRPVGRAGAEPDPGDVARHAAALLDRVAILALNSDRYFELMYALPWLGAVMVPLNTRLAAREIEYILGDSGAVALFVDAAMAHHLTALRDAANLIGERALSAGLVPSAR